MFFNFILAEGSDDWKEFIEFMGDKVELQGWTKYNGGLDTESKNFRVFFSFFYLFLYIAGTTGTHSIYLQNSGIEVMFHVSTMIPYSEGDEQQVRILFFC